jgi:hypothetical protein
VTKTRRLAGSNAGQIGALSGRTFVCSFPSSSQRAPLGVVQAARFRVAVSSSLKVLVA